MRGPLICLLLVATGAVVSVAPPAVDAESSTECAAAGDTAGLNRFIATEVADLVGFDTTRVIALPDGRKLWTVQDAFISATPGSRSSSLRPPTGFAHNALVVQEGNCFTTLHGTVTAGEHCSVSDASYVGRDRTATCSQWFWPMGGGVDRDGTIAVFYALMANEVGSGAAPPAHPVSVWVAHLDPATFEVRSFAAAPASNGDVVYGFAVESDASFSYLFGWSYDQFNLPDATSPPPSQMFVGRVPVGRYDTAPSYWNGANWVADRSAAAPISTSSGEANAMQPRMIDGQWVAVVKAGDWSGTTVRIDTAPAAQGPWTTVQTITVPTRTLDGRTNTYSAHLLPGRAANGNLVVSMSNNAWQMNPVAFDAPTLYQPRLFEVAAPPSMPAPQIAATTEPLGFVPSSPPIRAMDTRDATPLAGGATMRVSLAGLVSSGARAAIINLTAVDPVNGGYLTAWSCDEQRPPTSNLNYVGGATRATHAVVTLAGDTSICVFTLVETDVIVDVTGSYSTDPAALRFHPLAPTRIYDSRISGGRWRAGETRPIDVPPGAAAVAVNLTVTEPGAAGFVTVFPCQAALPLVSNINYVDDQVVANLVQIGTAGGTICVHSRARTHIVLDLQGTYDDAADGLRYQAVPPSRLVDTRDGVGSVYGRVAIDVAAANVLPSNGPVATTAVPAAAKALVVSMIAVDPRRSGWGEIGPCVEPARATPYFSSTLNFVAGDVVANQAITPTRATSGADVCTFATSPAFHVVDLTGWFV